MDNSWSACWKWETLETSALEQEEEPAVAGPVAAMGPDWTSTHQRTIHRMAVMYRKEKGVWADLNKAPAQGQH
jgi:hypothetical protein